MADQMETHHQARSLLPHLAILAVSGLPPRPGGWPCFELVRARGDPYHEFHFNLDQVVVMRKLFYLASLLGMMLGSAHAVQVSSTFDNAGAGLDGWTVTGDAVGGAPVYMSTGGNPGGYAEVTDSGLGSVMYWVAPAKFTGDLSAYFGGILQYDMRQSPASSLFVPGAPGDVRIEGAGLSLVFSLPATVGDYPNGSFRTFALQLDDQTAWRVGSASGLLATDAQIQSALNAVSALRIRGEYSLNLDVNGLDNVMLNSPAAPVPEPATASLMLGGAALLAWQRGRRRAITARP